MNLATMYAIHSSPRYYLFHPSTTKKAEYHFHSRTPDFLAIQIEIKGDIRDVRGFAYSDMFARVLDRKNQGEIG